VKRSLAALCLAGPGLTLAAPIVAAEDPFAPLAKESRPLTTRWQVDYTGSAEIGMAYVGDDNFMFGQYNGLNKDEATLIGDLRWRADNGNSYWRFSGTDLGLDTRNGTLTWGLADRFELQFELDSQQQVRNDTGKTPYRGSSSLQLPDSWIPSNITSGFANLDESLHSFTPKLERDRYSLAGKAVINEQWNVSAELSYEEKDGTSDVGGAFFIDASAGHSAILPMDVDFETTEFDLTVDYQGDKLQLSGSWFYSDFDNGEDLQRWQNPYNAFFGSVNYPNGEGGLGLAPDNEQNRLRLLGVYTFSPTLRLQVDGSYARTEQDQDFADYTVNPNLRIDEPLAVNNLDGELDTSTLDSRLFYRPWAKLNIEARYHGEKRDYDGDRNGYRYVPGDAASQSRSALTVYNSFNDYTRNRYSIEASYRLPWRSKLWAEYAYEEVERENAAVEETEEDLYRLRYRIRPLSNLSTTLEISYSDRAADTYQWDQSYYALLDSELINNTPDSQRYNNHPLMSQYYLSNRERSEGKWDISWQPDPNWTVTGNLLWRENDYSKSDLGLTEDELTRVAVNASWLPHSRLTISAWASYDQYETDQSGRSFRGGIEKNAFEVNPPLPQASDPSRNWGVDVKDSSVTLGINANWRYRHDLAFSADYNYVETTGDYGFSTVDDGDIVAEPLPDDESTQHHLTLEGVYDLRDNLSIRVNYQYWRYDQDNWAINGVTPTTIDKVLTLGEQEADEDLHYIGTSVIYRWQ
jgi:MtrB/PioB family decaheme-associated outer membrane protein